LRINTVGLDPKRTGGWRLIENLSLPLKNSVNEFIEPDYRHVKNAHFDEAVQIVQRIGKMLSVANNLLICFLHGLLGIKSELGY
jgi:hypothetical protein